MPEIVVFDGKNWGKAFKSLKIYLLNIDDVPNPHYHFNPLNLFLYI